MVTISLLSGRSRHGTRKIRSHHSSKSSSQPKTKEEGGGTEEIKKPDVEELRQRRAAYYSVSPAERRRVSASSTDRTKTKTSPSSTRRSAATSDRKHRRRSHKSGSRKPEKSIGESQRRTEDYVYGSRPSLEPETPVEETDGYSHERRASEKRYSRHSGSSSRRSLPTVFESEVTPDDSISQVGGRDVSDRRRSDVHVRPSLRRSSTTSARLQPVLETHDDRASVTNSKRSSQHNSSIIGSMLRRHSTTSAPQAPRLVECLTCGSDDIPSAQSAKLACGHRMCHDCLKRVFQMSVKDPAHMPPKCCTDQHIPLKHVEKLFDVKFKMLWNRKYHEYSTKNRTYCPTLKCGEWIKPSHIHTAHGRKFALCPRCKTKVCTLCNNKLHKSSDCPKDPEIAKLVEQAREKGWQRCFNCSSLVELKEGCNHMTCRCLAEFCMMCGAKWKTCDCPWFNYSSLLNPDRLNERVPEPIQIIYRQVFRAAAVGPIPPPPPVAAPAAAPAADPPRSTRSGTRPELIYQEEIEQRRRQERLDADLARRLQLASLMEPDDDRPAQRREDGRMWGLGNAAGHLMNDDFVQNAANVVMSAFGDTNFGRRGERQSGRRRRARQAEQNDGDDGLAPNFLGDESVLGAGPTARRDRAAP